MLRIPCGHLLVLSCLLFFVSATSINCNCDDDNSFWSVDGILQSQKVSDFLIAIAYFSIPLELLYFSTWSNIFPFKWVILQFGAFIVLCGLTHFLNVFTYEPHSFHLMFSLTISKFLTALVSFATTITLLTLIPQLLRMKVRENMLRMKACELDREVGLMKRQEAARWHVRMLTQEIRKSLDRHTILYTTLVELSKTLGLQNCAVWMPNEDKTMMNRTHELRERSAPGIYGVSIPINDPDIREITRNGGVKILRSDSLLACRSSGEASGPGAVAAIRMPMLKVSDFKGGTPQIIQTCYAILVLVLPRDDCRFWSYPELEIVEVVADQVAVALSHAAVLEESQLMRDRLVEQNRVLQQAKTNAVMAIEARNSFQSVMSQGMRMPMHSIVGLLFVLHQENLSSEQRLVVETMEKTSCVVVKLIDEITETPAAKKENLALEMRQLQLHTLVRAAASLAKTLCLCSGLVCDIKIDNRLPDHVIGDETRIVQVIIHMLGNLLCELDEGVVTFKVHGENGYDKKTLKWAPWKANLSTDRVNVKFEIGIKRSHNQKGKPRQHSKIYKQNNAGVGISIIYTLCKKLVQMMQGNIWAVRDSDGNVENVTLLLGFQLLPSRVEPQVRRSQDYMQSSLHLKGIRVLLAENDSISRSVTEKVLEKLGCLVFPVSSCSECLITARCGSAFDLVIMDIHMPEMDCCELASKLSESGRRNTPLIVALTVGALEDVMERCLESGIVGVIQKPVMLPRFVDELNRVLQKREL